MAFYVNFDGENVTKKMPNKLQVKQASNLTKELLQARLDAAEQRRKVKFRLYLKYMIFYRHRSWRKNVGRKYRLNLSMTVV